MKFVDSVKIHVKSGNGGSGCTSFRREKYIPRGGPNGGDGGHGGNIVFIGDASKNTLLDLSFQQHQHAQPGQGGMGKDKHGKNGSDCQIHVPLGTIIRDEETQETYLEILEEQEYIFLKGGRGGKGNARFKTSQNRAPEYHQPGEEGQELWVRLELKLIADVGLVGFPNAGKSTFISSVSQARPKVADYPFTTLVPNLGVVHRSDYRDFVIADIPGIIENAHEGTGLGHQFLKHIERTSILALLVDVSGFSEHPPLEEYEILLRELELFSADLIHKPRMVLLTKQDSISDMDAIQELQAELQSRGEECFLVSSVAKTGLDPVLDEMAARIEQQQQQKQQQPED